jgi:hypothetical protein
VSDVLVPTVNDFMRWLDAGTFPEEWIDGDEDTTETIKALNPESDGSTVELPADLLDVHRRLAAAKEQAKASEAEVDALSNVLRHAIGAADYGVIPGGVTYSYKQQSSTRYDVPEEVKARYARKISYRVLKVAKRA